MFGAFVDITWVNGTTPAINATNLQSITDVVGYCDEELRRSKSFKFSEVLRYLFERNTRAITYVNDETGWGYFDTDPTSSITGDETNVCMGSDSVRCTETENQAGIIGMTKDLASTLDLTLFEDGSASTTDDFILIIWYVSDATKFNGFGFNIGDDGSNLYTCSFFSFVTGWNVGYISKANFGTTGSPTGWDSIDYYEFIASMTASANGAYFSLQYIQMIRVNPDDSNYFSFHQMYMGSASGWENLFSISNGDPFLYLDESLAIRRIGLLSPELTDNPINTRIYEDVLSFFSKFEFYCKNEGECTSVCWYLNSTNYVEIYVASTLFTMDIVVAGVTTSINIALASTLKFDDRILIYFEKNGDTFRAIADREGEPIKILEYEETSYGTSEGDIYLGSDSTDSHALLTDFAISHSMNQLQLEYDGVIRLIKKTSSQVVTSSVALQDDFDLWAYLAPNSMYRIEIILATYNASSSTPDIKIAYALTGDAKQATTRACKGLATGSTDPDDSNIKCNTAALTTAEPYGVVAGNGSYIEEQFLVTTDQNGGKIQLQWAQNVSNASNTQVTSNSYMIVTKVK